MWNGYGGFKTCLPFDERQIVGCEFYDYEEDPLETKNAVGDPKYEHRIERMRKGVAALLCRAVRFAHERPDRPYARNRLISSCGTRVLVFREAPARPDFPILYSE